MITRLQELLGLATIVVLVTGSLALTGCSDFLPAPSPKWEPDQAKRHEYFQSCLKALPAGPQQTKYNDWDEVVEACASASYHQSLYCVANCQPEPTKTGGAS